MDLTIFKTKNNKKFPESPYDDNTFIFENVKVQDLYQAYQILVSNNVLCLPLNIDTPLRAQRTVSNLSKVSRKTYNYIILDIDCNTTYKKDAILDYFKDYKCILGKSRSYNGSDNFNLKCILECIDLRKDELEILRLKIARDLLDFCEISTDSTKITGFYAPLLKSNILINNTSGKIAEKVNLKKSDFYQNIDIDLDFDTTDLTERSLYTFKHLGYKFLETKDGSTRYTLNNDLYFWNPTYPTYLFTENALKTINVYQTVIKGIRELLVYNENFTGFENSKKINKQYISKFDIQKEIQQFADSKNTSMYIKSPMGSAKSSAIKEIIDLCLQKEQKILIITPRISVAQDYYKKYKNIEDNFLNKKVELYLDNPKRFDVLICQYDSIFKYVMFDFDLVIFDEFESIITYSIDPMTNNFKNFEFLYKIINSKINLLVADAFLTGFEKKLIKRKTEIIIENDYRDTCDIISLKTKEIFFGSLLSVARKIKEQNLKISISVTSTMYLKTLEDRLKTAGLRVYTLSGENPKETNELIYSIMQEEEQDYWDVLIYSPVLTVGVSNMNRVDFHFHFDTSKSTDTISSLQMIKRSRKASRIFYYIEERKSYKPVLFDKIKEQDLEADIKYPFFYEIYEMNSFMELKLKKIGEFHIKIRQLINIFNMSRAEIFKYLLDYQFNVVSSDASNDFIDYVKYKEKAKEMINEKQKNSFDDKDYNKFIDLIGVSGFKDNQFKDLSFVYNKTKLDIIRDEQDKLIFISISSAYINDKNFLIKCWLYNILNTYKNKEKLIEFINNSRFDKKKIDLLKNIVKNNFLLEDREYTSGEDTYTKKALISCGFVLKNNIFVIDESVKKFSKYVIDC